VARTFRATVTVTEDGKQQVARVPIAAEVAEELGLRPGETLRASLRGQEFTGKVSGSLKAPNLGVPLDVVKALGIRSGQGVRLTVHGRAS
jgi:antitoxin component of MazEF toxin-antitoxin module